MELKGLDLLLTYRCTNRCPMCTYHAAPDSSAPMPAETVRGVLTDAGRHPLRWVMLFGGEPFLVYDLLLLAAREARRRTGAKISVFTNAFWAATPARAAERLRPLVEAGVAELYLSLDSYHLAVVPHEKVLAATRAGLDLGLDVRVDGRLPSSPSDSEGERVTLRALDRLCRDTGLTPTRGPHRQTGRAVDETADGPPGDATRCVPPPYLGPSLAEAHTVEIYPDGEVGLCAGISLGNAGGRGGLEAVLAGYRAEAHPIVAPLAAGGPARLLAAAVELDLMTPAEAALPRSACRACHVARRALLPVYPEHLRPLRCYGLES